MRTLSFAAVRDLGLAIPGVSEGTAYGAPALKLGRKAVASVPTNKSAEAHSLVVHIDLEQRAELLREHPDTYYITEHYEPYATVLVRLSKISRTDLKELLRDACRFALSSKSGAGGQGKRSKLTGRNQRFAKKT